MLQGLPGPRNGVLFVFKELLNAPCCSYVACTIAALPTFVFNRLQSVEFGFPVSKDMLLNAKFAAYLGQGVCGLLVIHKDKAFNRRSAEVYWFSTIVQAYASTVCKLRGTITCSSSPTLLLVMAPSSDTRSWLADASLISVVFIWGANFPILKAALTVMHPFVLNIFRFSISVALLGGIYLWRRGDRSFWAPMRSHGWSIVGLGLAGYFVYQVLFIVSVNNTTAGSAALIMAGAPLWTALIGRLSGLEVLRGLAWVGLFISLAGTALVILDGATNTALTESSLFGNTMMLIGAVVWGGFTTYNKAIVHDVSPLGVTFFGLLVALPLLVGLGIPYWSTVQWTEVDAWVWWAILYSGALSTGIAFLIWNNAVKTVGPSNTAVYNNLVPFVAVLGGAWFLGESVTTLQLLGGALIIGGVVWMRRVRQRRTV